MTLPWPTTFCACTLRRNSRTEITSTSAHAAYKAVRTGQDAAGQTHRNADDHQDLRPDARVGDVVAGQLFSAVGGMLAQLVEDPERPFASWFVAAGGCINEDGMPWRGGQE